MWVTYKRISSPDGKQWVHPDFAIDTRCVEKYIHPTDKTMFLANVNITDITGYEAFNVVIIDEINLKTTKRNFGIGIMITKYAFRCLLTFEERTKLDNIEKVIDELKKTTAEKLKITKDVITIIKDFESASEIDLSLESTIQAVNYFAVIGVILPSRVNEILGI